MSSTRYANEAESLYDNLKPGEVSTGTTIMAIPTANGVVLGADSRVSSRIASRTKSPSFPNTFSRAGLEVPRIRKHLRIMSSITFNS
jgi:hypothetical protein